jgi:uncharacterized protein (TIGR00296 family)
MRVAVAKPPAPPQLDGEPQQEEEEPRATAAADPTVASEAHCRFCFDALAAQLCGRALPAAAAAHAFAEASCALFVTWNKRQPRRRSGGGGGSGGATNHAEKKKNKKKKRAPRTDDDREEEEEEEEARPPPPRYHLRGCIGTLEPRPLRAALKDYALTSALRDRRFDPIGPGEVPLLKVTVSLLRRFERAAHPEDWDVGTHGVIVAFSDPALPRGLGRRSATFLPEVAGEQGWTQRQAVEAAVRKAGYTGPVTAALLAGVEVTRYQSTRWELTYAQWRRWARGAARGAAAGALVAAVERSSSAAAAQHHHHHHHHHGSGALLRALRRLLRGGGESESEEQRRRDGEDDEWEDEDEDEEEDDDDDE